MQREGKKKIEVRDRRIYMAEGEEYVHNYEIDQHGVPQAAPKTRRLRAPKSPKVYPTQSVHSDIESDYNNSVHKDDIAEGGEVMTTVTMAEEREKKTPSVAKRKIYNAFAKQSSKGNSVSTSSIYKQSAQSVQRIQTPDKGNKEESQDKRQTGTGHSQVALENEHGQTNHRQQMQSEANHSYGSQHSLIFTTLPNQPDSVGERVAAEIHRSSPEEEVTNGQREKGSISAGASSQNSHYSLVFATIPDRNHSSNESTQGKKSTTPKDRLQHMTPKESFV